MDEAKATREFAIFNVLIEYTGQNLTPDRVGEIRDRLVVEIETGPCAWAFQQKPQ